MYCRPLRNEYLVFLNIPATIHMPIDQFRGVTMLWNYPLAEHCQLKDGGQRIRQFVLSWIIQSIECPFSLYPFLALPFPEL